MIPPLRTPSKASWWAAGRQRATRRAPSTWLSMRSPCSLAGPQPKHRLCGANRCWRLGSGGSAIRPSIALGAGEDRIGWVATLNRPGRPTTPDPVLPTMTLYRIDPSGPVMVATQTGQPVSEYQMSGNFGHDAQPGMYLMRILSGNGELLADGRFDIVR